MNKIILKNGQEMLLREAVPDDAEALIKKLAQNAQESEYLLRDPDDTLPGVEAEREFIQTAHNTPGDLFIVAEIDGQLAGSLTFHAGKKIRDRHQGEFGISVSKAYWGLGIGGHMIGYMIYWARTGGFIRKIDLHVRADNLGAIHLYEKYGFVLEGRTTRGFRIRGEFLDVLSMGLQIDPEK